MQPSRRRFLRTAGLAGATLLAGCGSDGGDGPAANGTTETATGSPTRTPDAALDAAARQFVERLAAGEYEAAREQFAPGLASQVSADRLDQLWAGLVDERGPFVEIASAETTTVQGFDAVLVTAQFSRARQVIRVVFDGEGRVAGLQFLQTDQGTYAPPEYADRSAFTEVSRTIEATEACSLPATLSLPTGEGEVPAVVVVHGSGPVDRDGTVGATKPYRDLAWGLATRGVAVLRYEKRTAACEVDLGNLTVDDEVTDDAVAAVDLLRGEERVDSGRIAVVGHSLGGMLAPRIVAQSRAAGMVALAAPARPLVDLLVEQVRYLAELDGSVSDAERERIEAVEAAAERVRTLDVGDGELVLGAPRSYWESLRTYDPVATAADLDVPRAFLQGGRDYQVTVEGDFERWREALGGQANVAFTRYPELNHLFVAGEGPPRPAEYYDPGNVDERVVVDVAERVSAL
ncbi:alpha/beta hydrolase [Halomarina litorea]|uniref:alpha/beta hydrolase n=1 Tax=Halomarina litorea TaxID=2961595 RepID=UPI0020C1D1A1|nr:alpha/beta fold hydrolase [Halomarina sp. BCD28]